MGKILFHPQISAAEAASIAASQGGRLTYRIGSARIRQARYHPDLSAGGIDSENYGAALIQLRAAHTLLCGGGAGEVVN